MLHTSRSVILALIHTFTTKFYKDECESVEVLQLHICSESGENLACDLAPNPNSRNTSGVVDAEGQETFQTPLQQGYEISEFEDTYCDKLHPSVT